MKKDSTTVPKLVLIIDRRLPRYDINIKAWIFFQKRSLYYYINNKPHPLNIDILNTCCYLLHPAFVNEVSENEIKTIDTKTLNFYNNIFLPNIYKMELNILIDSPGGATDSSDVVISFLQFFSAFGGTINSFSFINTSSAAAKIFSYSDNRYCLNHSNFSCHISKRIQIGEIKKYTWKKKIFEQQLEATEEAIEFKENYKLHLEKFFYNHKYEYLKTVEDLQTEALDKLDYDLVMGGIILETWGIIDKSYKDIDQYLTFMNNKIGSEIVKHSRIQTFCKKMNKQYNFILTNNTKLDQKLPRFRSNKEESPEEKLLRRIFGNDKS